MTTPDGQVYVADDVTGSPLPGQTYRIPTKTVGIYKFPVTMLSDSAGNIFGSAGAAPVTATQTTQTVTNTSGTLLAASASRIGGYITAAAANTDNIYLSLNSPATSDDIVLYPGGIFQLTLNYAGPGITNAIYAISGSGVQKVRIVVA